MAFTLWYGDHVLIVQCLAALAVGAFVWFFFEYVLHRFAFHNMKGKGVGSREHLNHHVRASWIFDPMIMLAWLGVVLTGIGWGIAAAYLTSTWIGVAFGAGWI